MSRNPIFLLAAIIISMNLIAQAPIMNPIAGAASVCSTPAAGYSYSVSANNSPTSYQWSVISPSTGIVISNPNSANTTINFPNTNLNYTLMCTASNSSGVSGPVFLIIKVYETPSVTFSGAQSYCQGSSTNLSASPTIISASSTLFYNWSPSTGLNTTSGPSVVANPQTTTTYSILLTMGTCTNMAYQTITVNPLPNITAAITKTLFCKLDPQTLTINGTASSYSINSVTTSSQSVLNYSVAGGVLITILGETNAGCQSMASITFSVSNCVGLKEREINSLNDIHIYPNPNAGSFVIKKSNKEDVILIYNQLGALVKYHFEEDDSTMIVNGLSPGIYFITNGRQQIKVCVL